MNENERSDEVADERGDHFVCARRHTEVTRPSRPERAAHDRHYEGERHNEGCRITVEEINHEGRADRSNVELPLCADIEIAAAEGDDDAAGCDEQRHRPTQAALPGVRIEKRAVGDAPEHLDGGIACELEDDAAQGEREEDEGERSS